MKISLETVKAVLLEQEIPREKQTLVMDELRKAAEDDKLAQEDGGKPPKYAPLLITTLNTASVQQVINDAPFFIVEHNDQLNHTAIVSILHGLIKTYNADAQEKKKQRRLKNLGAALATLPAKALKDAGLKVRFKEPVIAICTTNELPDTFLCEGDGAESETED